MSLTLESPAATALVEVEGLKHVYGNGSGPGLLVLDDVNLTLRSNEIVACSAVPVRASRRCCARSPA